MVHNQIQLKKKKKTSVDNLFTNIYNMMFLFVQVLWNIKKTKLLQFQYLIITLSAMSISDHLQKNKKTHVRHMRLVDEKLLELKNVLK